MVREEKPEAELELSSAVYILNSWGPYIVERRSTVAIEKKSVNCWVAETKLTLTSLEGWIGVSWALLARSLSPESRVEGDKGFSNATAPRPLLYNVVHLQIYGSAAVEKLTGDFSIGLTSWCTFIFWSYTAAAAAHCGEAWGQRNGGEEVRDSPH